MLKYRHRVLGFLCLLAAITYTGYGCTSVELMSEGTCALAVQRRPAGSWSTFGLLRYVRAPTLCVRAP